ncbi:MSCRAMM family protein, partial [Lawsonibacter sp. LCP25S3_G6]|uniref:MSCRAMM family protein n=1 Tax=unclassified Lawsonibacter TaxID=2617946 RepID=UPI003F9C3013
DGHSVTEVTTGADGSAMVENLLPGVYEISEKSVPSPYLPDADPQLVTLYPNRDRDVYFENHKRPTVTIQKENSVTHDPIEAAEFHITWASNKTDTGEQRDLGTFQTDEAGQIVLEGIEDGWLKIEETTPALGYQLPDDPITEVYVKGGENKTVTISNIPLSALVVYKQDSVTGEAISGARFQLKYLGGEVSGSGGTVIGTYTTSANGSFTVTGLKEGYYICEELESDSGHVIDAAPQSFYISGEDQDIVTLYFSNAPKGAVLVKKVSAADNTPLSDVEFLVTKSDGSVVGDANGKFVTDSTGTFLVEGVEPGTTLVIKETRAKDGFLLDDTPQTVQVKEGQTVTVEFRNQPMGNLIIHKLSSKDKTPLKGVQFKITYADGTYLPDEGGKLSSNGLYWTNAEGQIILSGITGTVVVTEVESIPGYTIDPNTQSQTLVVNPDDTQQLYFYNAPVGGVEFTKVNEADKTETISGVTFEIRRVSDDALVDTVTTGKDGKVFLPLEADNYYAVETDCPDTFKLDPTPIYFTVKDGETTRKTVTNKAFSGILLHKIDAATRKGIYGVTFLLYDGNMNPVDQFTTDQNGYAYIDTLELSGKVYLRELENEGYIVDEQLKTVYVKPGETTEITWENRAITGQIQIVKKSADYNPTNGLPAGTLLEGAVFEIYDKAGNLVDTIRSDSRGLAVSKPLPLSRYTIREVKAPANYGVNETELTAYLEHEGQIVKFEVTNKSLTTGVSITKTGPKEIIAGQPVRYTFSGIANSSNVRLDNFYWRDTLPAEVRLDTVVTGTYNFPGTYKITYRVNGGEYRTLADNLSTSKNYTLAASATALGLASNERVTEVMFVFGQAPAGFAQVEKPYLHCTAVANLASTSFVNVADVGGVYNGQWVQAVSRWVTTVYGKPAIPTLPRTGY